MLLTEPVAGPLSTTSDAGNSASLNTAAKSNLGDRVLGKVEKNSFIACIALLDKGGHGGLVPQKLCLNQVRIW